MQEFVLTYYDWIKALHLIAVISWMAGLFYLPRLFVYHADAAKGSEMSETFKVMERRLLKIIMTPAMIATWFFGLLMLIGNWDFIMSGQGWMHAKFLLVFLLSGFQGALSRWRKDFEADQNTKSAKFYRMINEVPTLCVISIVILATVKPF
ncbi:MAG: protoporphyrinogen oxidase HemJ [Pseudomonadota bacterium]